MVRFQLYGGLLVCAGFMFTLLRNGHYLSSLIVTAIMLFMAANVFRGSIVEDDQGYCQSFWLTNILSKILRNSAVNTKQSSHSLRILMATIGYCTMMLMLFVVFNSSLPAILLLVASAGMAILIGWLSGEMLCNKLAKKGR